ncbi:MAG TPA: glutathione S-transferase family protein [Pirellulaceae bacterium]
MSVTILEMAHSPFCIPVTRALEACGVAFERESVPNGDRTRIARLTRGAYYAVPVLLDGDTVVHESGDDTQDVARYIDGHFAGGKLFPPELDGLQSILIPWLENEVESLTFKCVDPGYLGAIEDIGERTMIIRHKERKFGRGCVERWRAEVGELRAAAAVHFARLNALLTPSGQPWLLGNAPVYTDFLAYGILGNYLFQDLNPFPENLPALQDWHARLRDFRF